MFILHFLPDSLLTWFVNITLLTGVVLTAASYLTKYLPFIQPYRALAQTVGIICLVSGVYFKGGEAAELAWRDRAADLQAKIDIAEQRSVDATQRLNTEVKRAKQDVRDTTQAIKNDIARNASQLDSECRVSDAAIAIHNDAATNKKPRVAK